MEKSHASLKKSFVSYYKKHDTIINQKLAESDHFYWLCNCVSINSANSYQ